MNRDRALRPRVWLARALLRAELRSLEARIDRACFDHRLSHRIDVLVAALELL